MDNIAKAGDSRIKGFLTRLAIMVQHLDYTAYDYVADRLELLEAEVVKLRAEVARGKAGEPGRTETQPAPRIGSE